LLKNEELEIQVMGGLGNQLHCLAAGLVVANKLNLGLVVNSDRVMFGSNMNRRLEINEVSFPQLNNSLKYKKENNVRIKHTYELLRRNSKGFLPPIRITSDPDYIDSGLKVSQQLMFLPEKTRSVGGSFIDFEWADRAVHFGFPSELAPINFSGSYTKHLLRISDDSVALHVRLGDYLELKDVFPIVNEEYYFEALDLLKISEKKPIHIFTDSPVYLRDLFPRLTRIKTVEIVDPKLIFKPVETMSLMSKYKNLIACNSTFSSWAAWFSANKNVVTPIPHLKDNWVDRLPSEWHRISLK
jgi:hypothetical protein